MTYSPGKPWSAVVGLLLVAGALQAAEGQDLASARFRILVPKDAYVFVERSRMKSTGDERLFESPPVQKGRLYTYEISVIHEGKEVVREVRFTAGRTIEVDFRKEFENLVPPPASGQTRPYKPIRPEWLPRRV